MSTRRTSGKGRACGSAVHHHLGCLVSQEIPLSQGHYVSKGSSLFPAAKYDTAQRVKETYEVLMEGMKLKGNSCAESQLCSQGSCWRAVLILAHIKHSQKVLKACSEVGEIQLPKETNVHLFHVFIKKDSCERLPRTLSTCTDESMVLKHSELETDRGHWPLAVRISTSAAIFEEVIIVLYMGSFQHDCSPLPSQYVLPHRAFSARTSFAELCLLNNTS